MAIGDWNNDNCVFALLPICLKQGSNPAAFNTGNASFGYRGPAAGGTEYGVLTNMGSGYGYLTTGLCNFDGSNDHVLGTNITMAVNHTTGTMSFFTRFKTPATLSDYTPLITISAAAAAYTSGFIYLACMSGGKLRCTYGDSTIKQTLTTNTLSTNTWYTVGFTQNAATIKVYINGAEASYDANEALAVTFSGAYVRWGGLQWSATSLAHQCYWSALYTNVRSGTNITADHTNADTFYGLAGYSDAPGTDEVFDSLAAPASGIVIPVFMNQYRQRRVKCF